MATTACQKSGREVSVGQATSHPKEKMVGVNDRTTHAGGRPKRKTDRGPHIPDGLKVVIDAATLKDVTRAENAGHRKSTGVFT